MATRDAYQKKLEAQLAEWDAKLDVLAAKARTAGASARVSLEDELESLRARRADAGNALKELGKRGEDAWEDMKDGVEKAWDDMGKAMDRIATRFK